MTEIAKSEPTGSSDGKKAVTYGDFRDSKECRKAMAEKPKVYKVQRDDFPDFKFNGHLVAKVSTYDPDLVRKTPEGVALYGSKRWRELALYVTAKGSWIAHSAGLSSVPSEKDRHSAIRIDEVVSNLDAPDGGRCIVQDGSKDWASNTNGCLESILINFFGRDDLAKKLYMAAGISDVEVIE